MPEDSKAGLENDEQLVLYNAKDQLPDGPGIRIYNNQSKTVRLSYFQSSSQEFYCVQFEKDRT
jgi:hypothetical protein